MDRMIDLRAAVVSLVVLAGAGLTHAQAIGSDQLLGQPLAGTGGAGGQFAPGAVTLGVQPPLPMPVTPPWPGAVSSVVVTNASGGAEAPSVTAVATAQAVNAVPPASANEPGGGPTSVLPPSQPVTQAPTTTPTTSAGASAAAFVVTGLPQPPSSAAAATGNPTSNVPGATPLSAGTSAASVAGAGYSTSSPSGAATRSAATNSAAAGDSGGP
jgi:hypothetical protein